MYKAVSLGELLQPRHDHFDEDMAGLHLPGLRGVWASSYHGFDLADMSRLPLYRFEALFAQDGGATCVAPVEAMPWLRSLGVGGLGMPIDLSNHADLESVRMEWHPKQRFPSTAARLKHFGLGKYKPPTRDLALLPEMPRIEEFGLIQGNARSLRGIERYPAMQELELAYMRDLVDVSAIAALPNLERIVFEKCPNVSDLSALAACTKLKQLTIDGVRVIPSVQFARGLNQLDYFRLVETNVEDGDLSPADHVRLFEQDNRPHYNRRKSAESRSGGLTRSQEAFPPEVDYHRVPYRSLVAPRPAEFDADMAEIRMGLARGVMLYPKAMLPRSEIPRLAGHHFDAMHDTAGDRASAALVERMPWLKGIVLVGACGTLDLRGHTQLEELELDGASDVQLPLEMPRLRYLRLCGAAYACADLRALPNALELETLHLEEGSLRTLAGLERFPRLRVIGVRKQPALADVSALANATELRRCSFGGCRRIGSVRFLASAKHLVGLFVEACGSIDSVGMLRGLPEIRYVDLSGTRVLDRDYTPLTGLSLGLYDREAGG